MMCLYVALTHDLYIGAAESAPPVQASPKDRKVPVLMVGTPMLVASEPSPKHTDGVRTHIHGYASKHTTHRHTAHRHTDRHTDTDTHRLRHTNTHTDTHTHTQE